MQKHVLLSRFDLGHAKPPGKQLWPPLLSVMTEEETFWNEGLVKLYWKAQLTGV